MLKKRDAQVFILYNKREKKFSDAKHMYNVVLSSV